jgi:hypothetical protein
MFSIMEFEKGTELFIIEHQAGAGSQFTVAEDKDKAMRIVKGIMGRPVDNLVGDILKVKVAKKYSAEFELKEVEDNPYCTDMRCIGADPHTVENCPLKEPCVNIGGILPNDVEIEHGRTPHCDNPCCKGRIGPHMRSECPWPDGTDLIDPRD